MQEQERNKTERKNKRPYIRPQIETIDQKELLGGEICPRGEQTVYQSSPHDL